MKKLLILIVLAALFINFTNDEDNIEIPSTSIRMRVIANSNKDEDQNNKIKVKEELEKNIYLLTKNSNSFDETDKIINDNKDKLDKQLSSFMENNEINTTFASNYGLNYFPEKEFKGVTYKSGFYKSYVVTLGDGKGDNWWCVLYPPICLIDDNEVEEYEYHSLIKDLIKKYN